LDPKGKCVAEKLEISQEGDGRCMQKWRRKQGLVLTGGGCQPRVLFPECLPFDVGAELKQSQNQNVVTERMALSCQYDCLQASQGT
jgi:hypothetical protein